MLQAVLITIWLVGIPILSISCGVQLITTALLLGDTIKWLEVVAGVLLAGYGTIGTINVYRALSRTMEILKERK